MSALALGMANAACAQDTATAASSGDDNTVVVVKGVRASLTKSLSNKRKATQVVESIVAEDIGKLPDNNVIEALQRVTGVQVTDRAGGEVGTISIRGLPDVETTWNGRNIFTASGRSEALQDIPATLVRQIDVYKTRDASQLENGLAGQIDVSSLRPFDFKGPEISVAARETYLEPAKSSNPNISALFSNRWSTGNGQFGALLNLSYENTKYRNESVTPGALVPFSTVDNPALGANAAPDGCNGNWTPLERIIPSDCRAPRPDDGRAERPANLVACRHQGRPVRNAGLDPDHQRPSVSLPAVARRHLPERPARQARTPGRQCRLPVAAERRQRLHLRSHVQRLSQHHLQPIAVLVRRLVGNLGPDPASTISLYDGTNIMHTRSVGAVYGFNSGDLTTNATDSYVYALNGKWNIGDKLHLVGDLSYQDSTFHSEFTATRIDRVANQINVNFNTGDGTPSFHFDNDALLTQASNLERGPVLRQRQPQHRNATTVSLDGKYDADWGAVSEISFGVRYDDRKAEESSRTQSDDAGLGVNLGTLDAGYQYVNHDFFDGFGDVPRSWMDANGYYIRDHIDQFRQIYHDAGLARNPQTIFRTTDELMLHKSFDVDEKTASAYVMADTDSHLFGHRLRTNWGLRYVNVQTNMRVYDWDNVAYKYTGQSSAKKSVGKLLPSATIRYEPATASSCA
ncbi:MAG: TonB-dependent receptor plug domain-containing protein [Asticcacaulis sp.]